MPRSRPIRFRATWRWLVAGAVFGTGIPHADAEPLIDYCVGAVAGVSSASDRKAQMRTAIEEASASLDAAFELFTIAAPAVGGSVPPMPFADPKQARRLKRRFFDLTVRHWLSVKQKLCACPNVGEPPPPGCEQLAQDVARSCELEPRQLHGINVRCLVKGR